MSLLFLLLYVLLSATAQLPGVAKEAGVDATNLIGSPIIWGIVFGLSLVASVAIHEFSHVLVAQAHGAKAHRITLMMLGGVSELGKLPEKPYVEVEVALIGPIVSLIIGGLLLALHRAATPPELVLFGFWVGQLNIALGIFNLLPAFPTDGGRVLRSLLVSRQGLLRGTRNAVRVSRAMAWFFGIIGLLQFNIILILIAFFIYSAAQSELFVITARTMLKGLHVSDLMRPQTAVSADATLEDGAAVMLALHTTLLPVTTTGEPYFGVISVSALNRVPRNLWSGTRLRDIAVEAKEPCAPDDEIDESLLANLVSHSNALPVTQEGRVIGLIRLSEITETMQLRELMGEAVSSSRLGPVRPAP